MRATAWLRSVGNENVDVALVFRSRTASRVAVRARGSSSALTFSFPTDPSQAELSCASMRTRISSRHSIFRHCVDSKVPDIGKRVREVPAIHDLETRRKVVVSSPYYKQIICVALPPIGTWAAPDKAEGIAAHRERRAEGAVRQVSRPVRRLRRRRCRSPRRTPARAKATAPSRSSALCGVQIVHECRRQAARSARVRTVLRQDEQIEDAGVGASHPYRQVSRTMSTSRNRFTKFGGPSAGPMRPRPSWRAWSSPRRSTSIRKT